MTKIWTITYSAKTAKERKKLPKNIQIQLDLLARELELKGPLRTNWSHFGTLKKKKGIPENSYHCHLKSGKPTYVVCWYMLNKTLKIVEIYYAGTHEKAPY